MSLLRTASSMPSQTGGRVTSIELRTNGEVVLTVSDNGIGVPKQRSEGVGSRVLSLLSQQLGGTMDYDNLDQGCRVTLRMPKPSL